MSNAASEQQLNIMDVFIVGMRKGWSLATNYLIPNVTMAFIIIEFLKALKVLDVIGMIFSPVMGIFGLPGDSITVIFTAFFSTGAGVSVVAALVAQGTLTPEHVTIMAPGIFLIGSELQYMGRVLAVIGVETKYYPILFAVSFGCAALAMLTMRIIT